MRKIIKCFSYFRLLILVFVFLGHTCEAQEGRSNDDTCYAKLTLLDQEFNSGHYFKVDSLFEEFMKSACRKDANNLIRVHTILKAQRLADGYRLREADSLQKIIDSFKPSYFPFRIGGFYSTIGSNFGKPGHSKGLIVGFLQNINQKTKWGIDIAISYQKLNFVIRAADSQIENKYSSDGFILKANGSHFFYNFSPLLFYKFLVPDSPVDYGFFVGFELKKQATTFLNTYYYEYNYRDSVIQQSAGGTEHILKFNADEKSKFNNDAFFKNEWYFNFVAGLSYYVKIYNYLLVEISPYATIKSPKMKLENVAYTKRVNYYGVRFSCSFLLKGKELKKRPTKDL